MTDYQNCPRCGVRGIPVNKNGTLRKHVRGWMTWLPKRSRPICTPDDQHGRNGNGAEMTNIKAIAQEESK